MGSFIHHIVHISAMGNLYTWGWGKFDLMKTLKLNLILTVTTSLIKLN